MRGVWAGVYAFGVAAAVYGVAFDTAAAQQASTVPPPWTAQDIGNPSPPGSASDDQGVFTVSGGGRNIGNRSDQFQFVYQQITGDVDIVARVDQLTAADSRSKVGVMIRGSLAANAANAFADVTASNSATFQHRLTAGGSTTTTAGPSVTAPSWVRLVRAGRTVTAYASPDGATWTTIGSASMSLPAATYVGLAVTSRSTSATASATLSQVSVTSTGLPPPLQHEDVGSPAIAGSASYSEGAYTITAGGTDVWDPVDQFHYVYQPVTGDVDVTLHAVSLVNTHQYAKIGVMVRETLTGTAAHASSFISAGAGYSFERRAQAGGTSAFTDGGAGAPPGWVRLTRVGSLFTAYTSVDGQTWTAIGSDDIAMADTVYVGIAVTGHSTSSATTAVGDALSIKQGQQTNQPPAVTLTSPANGATYTAPGTVSFAASASDADGTVARVEYYNGGSLLGSATTAPYAFTWSSVPAGTYTLTAVAVDDSGGRTTSNAAMVTVSGATSTPPRAVVFHASPDHDTLVTSYRFEVFASGADPDTATAVATANLGKPAPDANGDITSDQSALFSGLAAGDYVATITAVGDGGSSRSTPVTFTR